MLSLGSEVWKKASVKLSDALIHITLPLLASLVLAWHQMNRRRITTLPLSTMSFSTVDIVEKNTVDKDKVDSPAIETLSALKI